MRGFLWNDQRVSANARSIPPLNTDERATLEAWLAFHRATLAIKCAGLDDAQAATPLSTPSTFTLTGLVQHMAEVEAQLVVVPGVLQGRHATSRAGPRDSSGRAETARPPAPDSFNAARRPQRQTVRPIHWPDGKVLR